MIKKNLGKIYISKQVSFLINLLGYPWKGKGAILMYHRILPDKDMDKDLNLGMAVSSSNFYKHMQAIKEKYQLCTINELIEGSKNNKFMVAITFDDGYKDNLIHALPILEEHKIPASIYITTKFLEKKVNMWWYELKETIDKETSLNFDFENRNFNFKLKNNKQKNLAYKSLRKILINLNLDKQILLLEKITKKKERKNFSDICLRPDDIKILDNNPLITIGCHSHNHLNLKILSENEIIFEIKKSLDILQNLLKHEISHFSYPYGGNGEVSNREYKIVKNLKFASAVTGKIFPIKKCNPYELPRIYVGTNISEKMLINHLSGFYNFINKFF